MGRESTDEKYASLASQYYRFPPTRKLTTLKEWQAYQKAEVILWEFVQLMMYFGVRIPMGNSDGTLPGPAYYFLRDTVMNILLGRCELALVDGDWLRIAADGEYEEALGPRPRRKDKGRLWARR